IAEFKVLTDGQQAEFGRAAGSNITIVTKSGTNEFHGNAYLFLRNEWMNANSWINNYNGLARARNRNRTEGFVIGGPIFIPGKLIPSAHLNKYGHELLNFYPLPNRLDVDNTYNYQYQFEPTDRINDRTSRVDYNISDKWKFYARLIQNSRDRLQSAGLNVNN